MIKDITFSQEITEQIYLKIPKNIFNFRWSLRVMSPTFWPDNANKNKLQILPPEAIRIKAATIGDVFH